MTRITIHFLTKRKKFDMNQLGYKIYKMYYYRDKRKL